MSRLKKRSISCDENVITISSDDENDDQNEENIGLNINQLGDYQLTKILSYLPIVERISCARVCSKWKKVIEKSFKCQSVLNQRTVLGEREDISEKALALIIRKCCNVRHIVLKGMLVFESDFERSYFSDNNIVETIAQNCELLETIDFGNRKLRRFNEEIEENVDFFYQIKKIVSQNINESALNSIINSPNIECIDIEYNSVIDMSALEWRRLGPNIRQLYLSFIRIKEDVVRDLCIGNGKQVTNLSISISDANVLPLICFHMKKLNTLHLVLNNDDIVWDFSIFSNLKQLRSVSINAINLKSHIFESSEFIDLFKALKDVNLLEMEIFLSGSDDEAITDESLEELSENCPQLEKLVIRKISTKRVASAGMLAIAQMRSLKHIDFMNGDYIDDQIETVITYCPSLRHLNLHNCTYVKVKIIDAFIQKAKENPNEKFTLDVVNTLASSQFRKHEREVPSNLKLLFKSRHCVFECRHVYGVDHETEDESEGESEDESYSTESNDDSDEDSYDDTDDGWVVDNDYIE